MKGGNTPTKKTPVNEDRVKPRIGIEDNSGCPYCQGASDETENDDIRPFQNCIPDRRESITDELEHVELIPPPPESKLLPRKIGKGRSSSTADRKKSSADRKKSALERKKSSLEQDTCNLDTAFIETVNDNTPSALHPTLTTENQMKSDSTTREVESSKSTTAVSRPSLTLEKQAESDRTTSSTASTTREVKTSKTTLKAREEGISTTTRLDVEASTSSTATSRKTSHISTSPLPGKVGTTQSSRSLLPSKNQNNKKQDDEENPCPARDLSQREQADRKAHEWLKLRNPRYQPKPTVTSQLRYKYWFDDCGRRQVKAFRGDWSKFPDELKKDWDIYAKYYKYRRRLGQRTSSIVKKIVSGRLSVECPYAKKHPIAGNRPFVKQDYRQPVRLAEVEVSPLKRSKVKRRLSKHFTKKKKTNVECPNVRQKSTSLKSPSRWSQSGVRKKPLFEVANTATSRRRREVETAYCPKPPPSSSYWPGSVDEINLIHKLVDERRQRSQYRPLQRTSKLMVLLANSLNEIVASPKLPKKSSESSMGKTQLDMEQVLNKTVTFEGPRNEKKSRKWTSKKHKNVQSKKVLVFGGTLDSVKASTSERLVGAEEVNPTTGLNRLYRAAKWMLPPSIPIQTSLTSSLRRRRKDKA